MEVRLTNLDQIRDSEPIEWLFPKGFEITGTIVDNQVILSLADLAAYIGRLPKTDRMLAPLRCVNAILTSMKMSRDGIPMAGDEQGEEIFTLSIDRDQEECSGPSK